MKRHLFFATAVAAQVAVLGAMAIPRALDVRSGTRVTLSVVPVDPMDLFRGEYVRLSYGISRIDAGSGIWEGPPPVPGGDVWVLLEQRDREWVPVEASSTRGKPLRSCMWLRGKCSSVYGLQVSVHYGLEEFFVHQGKGPQIESSLRQHNVFAEFAVAADGTGTLTALVVNGERIE